MQVPQYIGFAPNLAGGCLYWIHTHDASGIIHIEAPDINPPQGGPYTLGMLFDIWGQPLDRNNVAGLIGPGHGLRERREVRRRPARDSAWRAPADRSRDRNAARPAAELRFPGRSLVG